RAGETLLEPGVRRGKAIVDGRSENGAASAPGVERPLVRGGVDPLREPAHDSDAALRESRGQLPRDTDAVQGRAARADDGDGVLGAPGSAKEDDRTKRALGTAGTRAGSERVVSPELLEIAETSRIGRIMRRDSSCAARVEDRGPTIEED